MNESGNRSVLKQLQIIYYRKTDDYTNIPTNEPEASAFTRRHRVFTIMAEDVAAIVLHYGHMLRALIRGQLYVRSERCLN